MIIKFFELNKIDLNKNKIILFYGKNEGLKNESIKILLKNSKNILNFEEKEILENSISFLESTFSKSLFEEARTIIIKRATDKILKIIADLETRLVDDLTIILNSDTLDKKSKLRSFFEKNKKYICVPFYPDNDQTLSKLCLSFFQNLNIPISQSNINLIINKSNGDRGTLFNELKKIEMFSINKKKITEKEIAKLINLSEDYKKLGLSSKEVKSHIYKLYSLPILISIMATIGSILVLNFSYKKSKFFNLSLGVLSSVVIYYVNYFFNLLGITEKTTILLSICSPLIILILFCSILLVRVNEK